MRINVTQIKVEMTMYYFNNIYIDIYIYICMYVCIYRGEKEIKEEKC